MQKQCIVGYSFDKNQKAYICLYVDYTQLGMLMSIPQCIISEFPETLSQW